MMREMMSVDLSAMVNTNIYLLTTLEELERYRDYLDGIYSILENTRKSDSSLMSFYDIVRRSLPVP